MYGAIYTVYIKEMIPVEMIGSAFGMIGIAFACGKALPIILALNLGPPDDPDSVPMMKVILAFPMVFILISLVLFIFVFNKKTPKFLASIGKIKEAEDSLSDVYTEDMVK